MDKIIIQESLAPLLAVLTSNNNNSGTNINNNTNDMQSILTDNLLTTGQYIHNPGTGDSNDDVIIKPQDLTVNELPTGRNFLGKPTYQLAIDNPTIYTNKEFVDIGTLAQTIDHVIDVKALVAVFNHYGFNLQVGTNILTVNAYANAISYLRDNVQLFGVVPQLNFDLVRVSDASTRPMQITLAENGGGQQAIDIPNLVNGEEFQVHNFSFSDSSGYTDAIANPISINAGSSLFSILGETPHKEALMNLDIHYKSKAYPTNHIQLFYASDTQYFYQNKFTGGSDGKHHIKHLLLEYTKI